VVDSKVVNIQGAQYGAMNPAGDAVDSDCKEGDTKDRLLEDPVLLYAGGGGVRTVPSRTRNRLLDIKFSKNIGKCPFICQ
jgi:hypothetical protein